MASIASLATEGDDTFRFSAWPSPAERGSGLGGYDRLVVTGASLVLADSAFTGLDSIEALVFLGTRVRLTLGSEAVAALYEAGEGRARIEGAAFFRLDASALGAAQSLAFVAHDSGLAETVTGGAGDDLFRGRGGADRFVGGAGNDVFEFRAGEFDAIRVLDGGAGHDRITLSSDGDGEVELSALAWRNVTGIETILVTSGRWFLRLYDHPDFPVRDVFGPGPARVDGSGADQLRLSTIARQDLSFVVKGSAGDDMLLMGWGNDTLHAGAGTEALKGNSGDDLFVFRATEFGGRDLGAGVLPLDFVDGDDGMDTLRLVGLSGPGAGAANVLLDAQFADTHEIDRLQLSGSEFTYEVGSMARLAFEGRRILVDARGVTEGTTGTGTLGQTGRFIFQGGAGDDVVPLTGAHLRVTAGGGEDRFVVQPGGFRDGSITDFTDGVDLIELATDLDAVALDAALADAARDVAVGVAIDGAALGAPFRTLTLHGMTKATLSSADFVLV